MEQWQTDPTEFERIKYLKLTVGLVIDAIGMMTYLLPGLGELSDAVWAPISGVACFLMYRGKLGLIGGMGAATEEFLPFTDIVPSLTLVWITRYLLSPGDK